MPSAPPQQFKFGHAASQLVVRRRRSLAGGGRGGRSSSAGAQPKLSNNRKITINCPGLASKISREPGCCAPQPSRNPIPALMSLKQILGSLDRLTNPDSENARDFLLSSASFFPCESYILSRRLSFIPD
jgi:hypothetical protein